MTLPASSTWRDPQPSAQVASRPALAPSSVQDLQWAMVGLALVAVAGQAWAAEGVAVQGEAMPPRAQSVSAPATLRLVRLGAMGTVMPVVLPAAEEEQRAAMEEDPGIGSMRIGFHRTPPTEYKGDLTPRLRWVADPEDASISAAVTVRSPQALRVRLAIRARLPPRAKIQFFHGTPPTVVGTMDRGDFAGPEDADTGSENEVRWSPSVEGDTIGMEVTLPSSDARNGTVVEIGLVSHQYRRLGPVRSSRSRGATGGNDASSSELECSHVDIRCRDVGPNVDAVAAIVIEKRGGNSVFCSGTLMNDDDLRTFVPYFLTARHCIATPSEASSLEAHWFHQLAYCDGIAPDPRYTTTWRGADLLETSTPQDSTLLRLRDPPPRGAWWAGWDARSVGVDRGVYGVHHPGGDKKKFVAGITGPAEDKRICEDPENPDDTCFVLRSGIPIRVTDGATERGSSGSALFSGEYLVGVLSGGTCSDAYYGRFGDFYPKVRPWLDRKDLGEVAVEPTELRVHEGGSAVYELRLKLRPTATVTVRLSVAGDGDLSASPESVSFAPSTWNARRRVRVYASEDSDRDNGVATINHRVSSGDIAYDGIAVDAVGATERDNDLRLDVVTGVVVRAADDPGTLEVYWNAVVGADAYIVEWRTDHQQFASQRRLVVLGGVTATTLEELEEDVVYFVRVTAVSGGVLLDGPPSESMSVRTSIVMRPFLRGWRLDLIESDNAADNAVER